MDGMLVQVCEAFRSRNRSEMNEAANALVNFLRTNSLEPTQIVELARAIADSGDRLELPEHLRPFADVPSSGGPASLSTLLCPILVASCGVRVPKVSATGSVAGAVDSLGVLPNFQTQLEPTQFLAALETAGIAHIAQTVAICPADEALIKIRRQTGLMRNSSLAAASLLAKKLAVPGTVAAFDYRVGPCGNIGDTLEQGRDAAHILVRTAKELQISALVVLTNCLSFPSSALGRLESLELLGKVLTRAELSKLDTEHVNACIEIAARAVTLAISTSSLPENIDTIRNNLRSGRALDVFERHLEAQGSSFAQFREVISGADKRRVVLVKSPDSGFWVPPDLLFAKNWVKSKNKDHHVGIQLRSDPGQWVEKGQDVLAIRSSPTYDISDAETVIMMGSLSPTPLQSSQILAVID